MSFNVCHSMFAEEKNSADNSAAQIFAEDPGKPSKRATALPPCASVGALACASFAFFGLHNGLSGSRRLDTLRRRGFESCDPRVYNQAGSHVAIGLSLTRMTD